jgi:hypothetical protein
MDHEAKHGVPPSSISQGAQRRLLPGQRGFGTAVEIWISGSL